MPRDQAARRLALLEPRGEGQHAVDRHARSQAQRRVYMHLALARLQHARQVGQAVHRHPGAVRAALAGGAVAGGGRLDEGLAGVERAQLVQEAGVGGDDEFARIQALRGGEDA
jgi:hypothetical protein